MAMLVKFMELQRTMALFQNPVNNLRMCSEDSSDERTSGADAECNP